MGADEFSQVMKPGMDGGSDNRLSERGRWNPVYRPLISQKQGHSGEEILVEW